MRVISSPFRWRAKNFVWWRKSTNRSFGRRKLRESWTSESWMIEMLRSKWWDRWWLKNTLEGNVHLADLTPVWFPRRVNIRSVTRFVSLHSSCVCVLSQQFNSYFEGEFEYEEWWLRIQGPERSHASYWVCNNVNSIWQSCNYSYRSLHLFPHHHFALFPQLLWRAVHLHPELNILVTGGDDYEIRVWCLDCFENIQTMRGHTHWLWDLCIPRIPAFRFRPVIVSSSSDQTIGIFDILSGDLKFRLVGHTGTVYTVAYLDNSILGTPPSPTTHRPQRTSAPNDAPCLIASGKSVKVNSCSYFILCEIDLLEALQPLHTYVYDVCQDRKIALWEFGTSIRVRKSLKWPSQTVYEASVIFVFVVSNLNYFFSHVLISFRRRFQL